MFVGFRHFNNIYRMKYLFQIKLIVLLAFFSILIISCKSKDQREKFNNTETFDFSSPKIINLSQAPDEISGIAYYPKDTSVFAIIDEDDLLFKSSSNRPDEVKKWRFDKQREFEDIVYKDSTFYVMVSNGNLDKINVAKVNFPNASKKVNELESMYFSGVQNKLIMLCKQCEDDKKSTLSSYYLNDSANMFVNYQTMATEQLLQKLGSNKEKSKPWATAIKPLTKELYVLCSVNKMLFIKCAG